MKTTYVLVSALILFSGTALYAQVHPTITISVADLTTGQPIKQGGTVTGFDLFQVTVTTNGVNCAGSFVVTALGAPDFPPSVGVEFRPFTIGPAVGTNTMTGELLTANPPNDWKISASCHGAQTEQFAFGRFEFVAVP